MWTFLVGIGSVLGVLVTLGAGVTVMVVLVTLGVGVTVLACARAAGRADRQFGRGDE